MQPFELCFPPGPVEAVIDVANLLQVGDIVSVIDMPPKELTTWWRGKHGFQVGTTFSLDSTP